MIGERQYRLLQFELDDKRAKLNRARANNTRLTKIVETYRKILTEIYHISLNYGKHTTKLGIIKEVCRRYKIPKKPNSVEDLAGGSKTKTAEDERDR